MLGFLNKGVFGTIAVAQGLKVAVENCRGDNFILTANKVMLRD